MEIPKRYIMPFEFDEMPLGLYLQLVRGVDDLPLNWTMGGAKGEIDIDGLQAVFGPINLYPELYEKNEL